MKTLSLFIAFCWKLFASFSFWNTKVCSKSVVMKLWYFYRSASLICTSLLLVEPMIKKIWPWIYIHNILFACSLLQYAVITYVFIHNCNYKIHSCTCITLCYNNKTSYSMRSSFLSLSRKYETVPYYDFNRLLFKYTEKILIKYLGAMIFKDLD